MCSRWSSSTSAPFQVGACASCSAAAVSGVPSADGAAADEVSSHAPGLEADGALERGQRLEVRHPAHDRVVGQDAGAAEDVAGLGGDPAGLAGGVAYHAQQTGICGTSAACALAEA